MTRYRRIFKLRLFRDAETRADIEEEIRLHLLARAEQLMGQGWGPDAAHAEALRRFTRVSHGEPPLQDSALKRDRRLRFNLFLEGLRQDFTFAARSIRQRRTFSAAVFLTLAVAIGSSTAVFSVTYSILLRRLPYPDPSRIVALENVNASFTPTGVTVRKAVAADPTLSAAALYIDSPGSAPIGSVNPSRAVVAMVTPRFFDVFGVRPMHGRTFLPEEGTPATNGVAVLSRRLWRREFGGDSGIVGRKILANGNAITVIGVMPEQFNFPEGTELWVPLPDRFDFFNSSHGWATIARLRSDVTPAMAGASLTKALADQARSLGRDPDEDPVRAIPLQEELVASVRRTMFTLLGAAALVLLVACANVASLWAARGLARGRELAIRQALGAGRGRLSRLIVVEATVLSLAGAVGGIALAFLAQRVLAANAPVSLPRAGEIGLHAPVLAFGLALGVGAGLSCALLPLRRISDAALNTTIMGRPRPGSASIGWMGGSPLIGGEVALACLLTIGAGLLIRSYVNAERTSLGWSNEGILTARFDLPPQDTSAAGRDLALTRVIAAVSAIPGVRSVAATNDLPLAPKMLTGYRVRLAAPAPEDTAQRSASAHAVTPGYFRTMGAPLLAGRDFSEADHRSAPRVFIVNDSLRRELVGDGDIVGRRIYTRRDTGIVIGVAPNLRHFGPEEPARTQIYESFFQSYETAVAVVARNNQTELGGLAPVVRSAIARANPRLATYDMVSMDWLTSRVLAPRRFLLALLASFAAIALLLTMIGVFGVVSYSVQRRTRELGIRAALGARSGQLLSTAIGRSLLATAVGVLAALALVVPLRSTFAHFLFGVSPTDPTTLLVVAGAILSVAAVASAVPAMRAVKVDPASVLRSD